MGLLIAGVLLWSMTHSLPSVAPGSRAWLQQKLGAGPYRGIFALTIFGSIALMVFGWRSTDYFTVYAVAPWAPWVAELGVLVGLWLLIGVGSSAPSNVKRFIRHPQLTGFVIWAGSHLVANGDGRSVILFGGLGTWALSAMFTISRSQGAWKKPKPVALSRELVPALSALVATVALFFLHPYFTGVALPRPW